MIALVHTSPSPGAPVMTGFGSLQPSRTCSIGSLAASIWAALAKGQQRQPPAIQERKYAPYVPTHAGADFTNSATPRGQARKPSPVSNRGYRPVPESSESLAAAGSLSLDLTDFLPAKSPAYTTNTNTRHFTSLMAACLAEGMPLSIQT
ncbi:hypothetical protein F5X68DRAFT_264639 [Plectosphaerella plurivora]|uniref:Uncharacterized protein n=1 Tax=Plectosphaerella plurivora TaxID=936078 RepID=A0A9P8V3M3_9PEZI|nr:hypothetical protein F5X68DRAFT_264639 [Plectosphaerella plurivora]